MNNSCEGENLRLYQIFTYVFFRLYN
uniref:Uncharacterized protein n=2 Tax=Anguilla anguilla TaxID=7936 RepID=A0A0E9Q4D4_ANGAN